MYLLFCVPIPDVALVEELHLHQVIFNFSWSFESLIKCSVDPVLLEVLQQELYHMQSGCEGSDIEEKV